MELFPFIPESYRFHKGTKGHPMAGSMSGSMTGSRPASLRQDKTEQRHIPAETAIPADNRVAASKAPGTGPGKHMAGPVHDFGSKQAAGRAVYQKQANAAALGHRMSFSCFCFSYVGAAASREPYPGPSTFAAQAPLLQKYRSTLAGGFFCGFQYGFRASGFAGLPTSYVDLSGDGGGNSCGTPLL